MCMRTRIGGADAEQRLIMDGAEEFQCKVTDRVASEIPGMQHASWYLDCVGAVTVWAVQQSHVMAPSHGLLMDTNGQTDILSC